MDVYVVLARRWGSQESHSYVVGVFSDYDKAEKEAMREEDYRGLKYECEVIRTNLDNPSGKHYDVVRPCRKIIPSPKMEPTENK